MMQLAESWQIKFFYCISITRCCES